MTFDVAEVPGWAAVNGLLAGNLVIVPDTIPAVGDFDIIGIENVEYDRTPKIVTITAKDGKTTGEVTVKYNGDITAPSLAGTYIVTFDVAEAPGWAAVNGILAGNLIIKKKTFTDPRDNQSYTIVEMPDGKTWMAENLNYNIENNNGSWCYDNKPINCDDFGRLYSWNTAMADACPVGWHLPSITEWVTLIDAIGGFSIAGTKLKSSTGWRVDELTPIGIDEYGFSAIPSGKMYWTNFFNSVRNMGIWWSTTVTENVGPTYPDGTVYTIEMRFDEESIILSDDAIRIVTGDYTGLSVRCVLDTVVE